MENIQSLGIVLGNDFKDIKKVVEKAIVALKKYKMVTISMSSEHLKLFDEEVVNMFKENNINVRFIGNYYDLGPQIREIIKNIEGEKEEYNFLIFIDYSLSEDCFHGAAPIISSIEINKLSWKEINDKEKKRELENSIPSYQLIPFTLLIFMGNNFNAFPPRLSSTKIKINDLDF